MLDKRQTILSQLAGACALGMHLPTICWIIIHHLQRDSLWLSAWMAALLLPVVSSLAAMPRLSRRLGEPLSAALGQAFICLAFAFFFFTFRCDLDTLSRVPGGAGCFPFFYVFVHSVLLGTGLGLVLTSGLSANSTQWRSQRGGGAVLILGSLIIGIAVVYLASKLAIRELFLVPALISLGLAVYVMLGVSKTGWRLGDGSRVSSVGLSFLVTMPLQIVIQLFALILWMIGTYLGAFIVIVPLFSDALFAFGLAEYSLLLLVFALAILVAHVGISRRAAAQYPAQNAIFSLLYMSLIAYALSRTPTQFGLYCLVFFWGLNLAYALTHSWAFLAQLKSANVKKDGIGDAKPTVSGAFRAIFCAALIAGALLAALALRSQNFSAVFIAIAIANALMFVALLFGQHLWAWKNEQDQ